MPPLFEYARALVQKSGKELASGQIFAKVLSTNDDSGRHGVLIPIDAYAFFPNLPISDPTQNTTREFLVFDCITESWQTVAYKYYERYPERRITRLSKVLNEARGKPRFFVVLNATHPDGSSNFYIDSVNATFGDRFSELFLLIFGPEVSPAAGNFVLRPVDAPTFTADPILQDFLGRFDKVRRRGWIDVMRAGDTGIGYTFENLIGIEENNKENADFHGIEIKCQGIKEGQVASVGKINLFQAGPTWIVNATGKQRIRMLGQLRPDGLYACFSQVSIARNNLGLLLDVVRTDSKVNLRKNADAIAYWPFDQLEARLAEKHARAAFVKAKMRRFQGITQFSYEEVVYCERPSIQRFIELVDRKNIVFEFTMSEKPNGSIRNHGYPWRLIRSEFLDQLFAFQIKLR